MKKKEEVLNFAGGIFVLFWWKFLVKCSAVVKLWNLWSSREQPPASLITTARIISRRSTQYFSHVSEFYVKRRTFSAAEVLKQVQFGCKCPSSAQLIHSVSRPWGASTIMWIHKSWRPQLISLGTECWITLPSFGFIGFPSDHHLNEDGSLLQSPWQNKVSLKLLNFRIRASVLVGKWTLWMNHYRWPIKKCNLIFVQCF